jgi:hypothetical protein
MRRVLRVGITIATIGVMFFFVPWVQTVTMSWGAGGQSVGWVSPSFAAFQCGVATGSYAVEVPNGSTVNGVAPFWAKFSDWNCEFPRLMV